MGLFTFNLNVQGEKIMGLLDDLQAGNAALNSAISGLGAQLDLVQQAVAAEAAQGVATLAQIANLQDQIAALPKVDPALETMAAEVAATLTASAANLAQLSTGLGAVVAGVQNIIPDAAPAVEVPTVPLPSEPPLLEGPVSEAPVV